MLFLDLREAFYGVARPLLVCMDHSDEDVARVFRDLNLPAEAHSDFRRVLAGETAIGCTAASEWLQAVYRELLSNTWFRLPHQEDVVVTNLGTRPGDSLADLLVSYLFATVIDNVRKSLLTEGFDLSAPWSEDMRGAICQVAVEACAAKVHLADCAWMDDLCLMVSTGSPQELVPCLGFTAGVLLDECIGHGLMPNLDRGKSEAILMIHGAGSRAVRREFLGCKDPTVEVGSRWWKGARLRITPTYKHLGGV